MSTASPDLQEITADQEDFERARAALEKNPRAMTIMLARQLDIPEATIVRAMPDGRSIELDAERWEGLLQAFEDLGQVHVIVSNGSVTIESTGSFGGFSKGGGFFNVQSDDLDMHIQHPQLAAAFAVRKPSHLSGVDTISFQFFDQSGDAAFKVFLTFGRHEIDPELENKFQALVEEYQLS